MDAMMLAQRKSRLPKSILLEDEKAESLPEECGLRQPIILPLQTI